MSDMKRPEDSFQKRAEAFFNELESRFECDPPDRRNGSREEEANNINKER